MNAEARLGFWSLAYLLTLHRSGEPDTSRHTANEALRDFDDAAEDLLARPGAEVSESSSGTRADEGCR